MSCLSRESVTANSKVAYHGKSHGLDNRCLGCNRRFYLQSSAVLSDQSSVVPSKTRLLVLVRNVLDVGAMSSYCPYLQLSHPCPHLSQKSR